jgi:hypothetical protein
MRKYRIESDSVKIFVGWEVAGRRGLCLGMIWRKARRSTPFLRSSKFKSSGESGAGVVRQW